MLVVLTCRVNLAPAFRAALRRWSRLRSARLTLASGLVAGFVALIAFGPVAFAGTEVSTTPASTPTFNGSVYAIAISGNVGYVAGDFTAALVKGKQVARQRLAAFDLTTGALLSWAPAADRAVRALAVADSGVWIGGDFDTVNGQPRDGLARLAPGTGALDPVTHRISGAPRALGIGHGRLYLAGSFADVDGVARANIAAFDLATGALLTGWAPTTDNAIETMVVTESRIYLGGSFHRTNNISSTGRLIALKPDATVDLTFRPQPPAVVYAIAVSGSHVYAGLGGVGGRTISYTTAGKAEWNVVTDGDVQALAVLNGTVYHGGHFDNVCTSARTGDHGVCLDGSVRRVKLFATDSSGALLAWTADGNGIRGVLAMIAQAGVGVAVGGDFTTIGGTTQKRFALFN